MIHRPLSALLALVLLTCFSALCGPSVHAADHYADGLRAFEAKDFPGASAAFRKVIDDDRQFSSDLFFNLGNTHFRMDEPGVAALWYRRALAVDPTDGAARQNLRLLKRKSGFHAPEPSLPDHLTAFLPRPVWRGLALAGVWSAAIALAALIFLRPLRRGRAATAWTVLGAGLALGAGAWWVWTARAPAKTVVNRAVVTQANAKALTAPTEMATGTVIDLPPGSELIVEETRDDWLYVRVPSEDRATDSVGWVRRALTQPLWPYNTSLLP